MKIDGGFKLMNDYSIDSIIDGNPNMQIQKSPSKISETEEYLSDFLIETKEHLESIETNILILEKDKGNKEIIDSIFRDFHTIKGLAGFVSQPLVQKIAHQVESILDKCRKRELEINDNLLNLILTLTDSIKSICENLELNTNLDFIRKVNNYLNRIENLNLDSPQEIANIDIKNENNALEISNLTATNDLDSLIDSIIDNGEQPIKKSDKAKLKKEDSIYVRIPIKKIDALVDIIGELAIQYSQFEEEVKSIIAKKDKLNRIIHKISNLTKDIQNISISLRMVSLKSVFQRIYRIGKDTVLKLNKKVEFHLYGEETEIDRGVVEKIVDPLIHLIKNSIYHGIEDEFDRVSKGKSLMGTVKIEAYSTKGYLYISVSDDGGGIDTKKVLKKAIEKNLVDPLANYSEKEILNFVFLPGFSTVEVADDVAGRGVGLDVVKSQISKIGGRVEINNILGQGCSFIMKMPINMAIIRGTVVDIGDITYIIPTLSIRHIFKPKNSQFVSAKGIHNMIRLRDDIIPVVDIKKILDLKSFHISESVIVVLESGQKLIALPVSFVIENRDIIVKPLGEDFNNLKYAFGATILGNGKISVILDVESFFEKVGE
jgi:two-component system chemotaxis sensor kinase CheA